MTIDIELAKPYSHVRLDGKKYSIEEVRQALAARATPAQPMNEHNARFAIDGAIQYGRENRNKPPSDDHWLMEYWLIGQQLRELGKTGWDNRTPLDPAERPSPSSVGDAIRAMPLPERTYAKDVQDLALVFSEKQVRALLSEAAVIAEQHGKASTIKALDVAVAIAENLEGQVSAAFKPRASAGPSPGDMPHDRMIQAMPLPRYETTTRWKPLKRAGQVKVGDKLRFNVGGKKHQKTAIRILNQGTDKEEIIYSTHKNFYFITSMVIAGSSTHKNVEFFPAAPSIAQDGQKSEGA